MDINIYIFIIEMEINMFDDNIEERYSLAIERISEINKDDELSDYGAGSYADYFKNVSAFILLMDKLKNDIAGKAFDNASLEELGEYNRALYKVMLIQELVLGALESSAEDYSQWYIWKSGV